MKYPDTVITVLIVAVAVFYLLRKVISSKVGDRCFSCSKADNCFLTKIHDLRDKNSDFLEM